MEDFVAKVLIVDDRPENLLALRSLLDFPDVHVLSATSAQDALGLILDHEFALALLDVQMPDVNGYELARLMRGSQRSRHIPVIFVTAGQPSADSAFAGYEEGAVDFLCKPLNPFIVRSKVRVFTELERQRRHLQKLKEEAVEASRAKSRFLANMSHEIRTPLAVVLGYSDLLCRNGISKEERQIYSDAISRNGRTLAKLIDDVLDLSKIEAGGMEVEQASLGLADLFQEIGLTWAYRCQEKGLIFSIDADPGLPAYIRTDPTKLRQILANLLSNALKFTDSGSIRVRVTGADGAGSRQLSFAVADTGAGMTAAAAARLFRPFTQGDSSTTRRYGGTGLGLSIAREMAQALGGDVTIATTAPGMGSTFVASVALVEGEAEPSGPDQGRLEECRLEGFRILVTEDHPEIRGLISHYLREVGATVLEASDGAAALESVGAHEIDLMIVDMHMPFVDGYQTARSVRQRGFDLPILALTAAALSDDRRRCLEAGCDDYLSKPVQREALLRATTSLLHRKPPPGCSVLIVEDNPLLAKAMQLMLGNLGARADVAPHGAEALILAGQQAYDMVLLDLQLPDLSGEELLDRLRETDNTRDAFLVAHTGHKAHEVPKSPQGRAFDGYCQKPAGVETLTKLLWVSRRRAP